MLTNIYLKDKDIEGIKRIIPLLTESAEKGVDTAQFALAKCFLLEEESVCNLPQAIKWLTLSAEQGNPICSIFPWQAVSGRQRRFLPGYPAGWKVAYPLCRTRKPIRSIFPWKAVLLWQRHCCSWSGKSVSMALSFCGTRKFLCESVIGKGGISISGRKKKSDAQYRLFDL